MLIEAVSKSPGHVKAVSFVRSKALGQRITDKDVVANLRIPFV